MTAKLIFNALSMTIQNHKLPQKLIVHTETVSIIVINIGTSSKSMDFNR